MTGKETGKNIPSSTIDVIMGFMCNGHNTMGEEWDLDSGINGVQVVLRYMVRWCINTSSIGQSLQCGYRSCRSRNKIELYSISKIQTYLRKLQMLYIINCVCVTIHLLVLGDCTVQSRSNVGLELSLGN